MPPRWEPGEIIVRREVLGLSPVDHPAPLPEWYGRPWTALPVHVVEDTEEQLVTFTGTGAEMEFPDALWPTDNGRHPWHGRPNWDGHGCLMVQRPGDPYAVWHFWNGPEREFSCWYLNIQADFVRTPIGYDTQDLELDYVVFPDGTWVVKDLEVMPDRVTDGRYTAEEVDWILSVGDGIAADLDARRYWWDPTWADWTPPAGWHDARLSAGWADVPTSVRPDGPIPSDPVPSEHDQRA